jgi:bla regulator protein blaR1
VRDGTCGKVGKERETVVHREEAGQKVMIICTDRIEALTAESAKLAMRSKQLGLMSARMGIRQARHAIEFDTNLSASQRKAALAGLDEALAEIAQEDKDD